MVSNSMISQIIILRNAVDLVWYLGDFSQRNHMILGDLGFHPSVISRREIGEKSPVCWHKENIISKELL